jgi:hypothetical protein
MQVFELYFNPKNETKISESFHYKPSDAYEGKIGRIYMVGEITNPEKKDYSFLQNVFHVARENYYKNTSSSPETALKETLKEINAFIKEREYDGKLNILFLASKNFSIYLGKIGRIKVFLTSGGSLKDIGEELENTDSNLFSNMVSGKMKKNDRLIILTTEIYKFFKKEKIFDEISKASFGEKMIEKISLIQKEKYKETSGIALVIDHSVSLKEKQKKVFSKEKKERFSFKKVLFYNLISFLKIKTPKINFKIPSFQKPSFAKKSLLLPMLLFGVIALGSLIIGIENSVKLSKERETISLIKEKISLAKEKENFLLMEEILSELEQLMNKKIKNKEEIFFLYNSLEKELFEISLTEEVEEINLIGEIEEIDPNKIVLENNKLYLFSSSSNLMVILNASTKETASYPLPIEKGIALSSFSNGILFLFSTPNNLVIIEDENISKTEINLAYENQKYISLSSFLKRPYFLDSKGSIFRYVEKTPISWIKEEGSVENGLSLAIDGSIFILTSENKIHRYHEGEEKEIFDPFVFPSLKTATKIYTSPESPIFVLDPKEKRIIVVNKEGQLVKQIFNEKFSKLKDIAFDGEKIYLLIDKEVYITSF